MQVTLRRGKGMMVVVRLTLTLTLAWSLALYSCQSRIAYSIHILPLLVHISSPLSFSLSFPLTLAFAVRLATRASRHLTWTNAATTPLHTDVWSRKTWSQTW